MHLLEQDRVRLPEDLEPLAIDLADDAYGEAGAGERVAPHDLLGEPELLADTPHLVLEQLPQRLDELHRHVFWQAADIVVRLDPRRDARLAAGLDHVGVEGSLDEEAHVAESRGLLLEDADEILADPPSLLLRVADALEAGEEPVGGVDVDELDVEMVAERLDDPRRLVLAQEAVVDEDAGQLVADRPVHEQRRHRRVDAAREATEHAALTRSVRGCAPPARR